MASSTCQRWEKWIKVSPERSNKSALSSSQILTLSARALKATISRGNPGVPKVRRRDWPPAVILKYAGARSRSAFERGVRLWNIEGKNGMIQVAGNKKQPNGMWLDDPEQTITLPSGTSADSVIDRIIAIIQDAARK
jgi:hypothetical protein